MPTGVAGPIYARNGVRITITVRNWDDLQVSADSITVSLYKKQDGKHIPLSEYQKLGIGEGEGYKFQEQNAGEYTFLWDTRGFTGGSYTVVFDGEVDGTGIYEPVDVELKAPVGGEE